MSDASDRSFVRFGPKRAPLSVAPMAKCESAGKISWRPVVRAYREWMDAYGSSRTPAERTAAAWVAAWQAGAEAAAAEIDRLKALLRESRSDHVHTCKELERARRAK